MNALIKFHIPFALVLWQLIAASEAGLIVTDPTLIATNRTHQAKDLAEQLLRKAIQEKQLERLGEQIAQLEDYLERYGDPARPVGEKEFAELLRQLLAEALTKNPDELLDGVDGREVFEKSGDDLYRTPNPEIVLDGQKAGRRDPERYRKEAVSKRSYEQYRKARIAVQERRETLRKAIATTASQLQGVKTEAEQRKLTGLLIAQQTQLRVLDQEAGFAATEFLVQERRAEARRRLEAKLRAEKDRMRHRKAMKQDAEFYRLPTRPTFFRANHR